MLPNKNHAERKRMLAGLYSKSNIYSSPELREISRTVISGRVRTEVHAWARDDATVDVLEKNKACLMDVTSAWLFGLSLGTNFLQDPIAADLFFNPFKQSSSGFFWRSEFPKATKCLQRIGIHLVPRAAYHSRRVVQKWCSATCEAAFESMARHPYPDRPLVYTQFRRSLEQSHLPVNKLEATLSAELLDHLVASHDVSGITLTYLMHELSRRRPLQRSLKEEISKLPGPDSASLAHRIDTLPLLDAILMETLRLHSANPGPWPRRTPASGCRIGDFSNIPANTIISASSYSLHRNPAVFPQPEEWLPERWLDATAENRKEMMRWFWAFGSGARLCLGSHFAVRSTFGAFVSIRLEGGISSTSP